MIKVIKFGADWCGPCKRLEPIIETLVNKNTDVDFQKVNVDTEAEITVQYGIRNIPVIVFLKDGNEVDRMVGLQSETAIQTKIDSLK